MKISRVEDKKFQIVISEYEALKLADDTLINFEASRVMSNHIGSIILHYIIEASKFPHDKCPTVELEF